MNHAPTVIAIVGGSGAGKTWLSRQIATAFPTEATCVSLDEFYYDRSHLDPAERRRVNYDDPQAIEWELVKEFLTAFRNNHPTHLPHYEFATHCRDQCGIDCVPTPLLLIEGLWLLIHQGVRQLIDLSFYIDCPAHVRLERRLARDVVERGRRVEDVRRQFESVVAPMHRAYVEPQRRFANVVLHDPLSALDVEAVIGRIDVLLRAEHELVALPGESEWRNVA